MKLHIESVKSFTLIENKFIDEYMPSADGEFVKLYLYLLRCAGSGTEVSVSSMADFFDHTEKDIRRALLYWERLHLLRLSYSEDGNISDICLLSEAHKKEKDAEPSVICDMTDKIRKKAVPPLDEPQDLFPSPSRVGTLQIREAGSRPNIKQLIFVGSQYKGRPLNSTEIRDIVWMSDFLHFEDDLIEYLMEYCVTRGSTSARYFEKVAGEWYREKITTVAKAKEGTKVYNKDYYTVLKALGISGRNVTPAETKYIDRWEHEYGFPMDIILEACSRTVLNAARPNFEYVNTILENWHAEHVTSLEDILKLDKAHERSSSAEKFSAHSRAAAAPARPVSRQPGTFSNIPQHDYDWPEIESRLGVKMRAFAGKKGD